MNVQLPSSVNLDKLPDLAAIPKQAMTVGRKASPAAKAILTAASALAWRLAPVAISKVLKRRQAKLNSRRNLWIAGGLGLGALALLGRWQLQRLFRAEPEHTIELKQGRFEIRSYPSLRVAETSIDDETWDEALGKGFRRLASFIFGDNDTHAQLAMTTPMFGTADASGYRFSFVLPESTTSVPNDKRVEVTTMPARRVGALRFNGRHNARSIAAQKRKLLRAVLDNGLTPSGEVLFASYDPPTTLPILRRNELWVELSANSE